MKTTKRTRKRNTKRATVIMVWALLTMLLFSSCSLGSLGRAGLIEDDKSATEKTFKKVLPMIEQRDKDKLKSMFSKKALREAENLDDNMDYIFDLFQGEVKEWKQLGLGVYTDIEYGEKRKKVEARFIITTDKDTYLLFFYDYPVDDFDPDNIGIYTMCLMTKKEWDKKIEEVGTWKFVKGPGICIPEKK